MNRRNASIEKNESEVASARPKRIAVGLRPKLSVDGKDPNYEYRIVNDTPGRIAMFQQSGWELCTNDEVNTGNFRADQAAELGSLAYHIVDGGNFVGPHRTRCRYRQGDGVEIIRRVRPQAALIAEVHGDRIAQFFATGGNEDHERLV